MRDEHANTIYVYASCCKRVPSIHVSKSKKDPFDITIPALIIII